MWITRRISQVLRLTCSHSHFQEQVGWGTNAECDQCQIDVMVPRLYVRTLFTEDAANFSFSFRADSCALEMEQEWMGAKPQIRQWVNPILAMPAFWVRMVPQPLPYSQDLH